MLNGGVDIVRALETLSHQPEHPNFGLVIQEVTKSVTHGQSFSGALSAYPRIFSPLYVTMVRVGESTGSLAGTLEELRSWIERDEATVSKVKSALTYPTLVLIVASTLTMLLFQTVVPKFLTIFENMKIELPSITKLVMLLTQIAQNPGSYILGVSAFLGCWMALKKAWSDPQWGPRIALTLLEAPVVGALLRHAAVARFATAAELSLNTGLNMITTVELGCAASGNRAVQMEAKRFVLALSEGEPLSEAMAERPVIWGNFLPRMLAAGEESASVPAMLARARELHSCEMELLVDNLGAILEPILLLSVATIVGVVLLSVFIPLYSILGALGG